MGLGVWGEGGAVSEANRGSCRLLLVPLGGASDLQLRQLDVADDVGVCERREGHSRLVRRAGCDPDMSITR